MRILYRYFSESWDYEAFFDEQDQYITGWSGNDACYRDEYMTPLLRYFGGEIRDLPKFKRHLAERTLENILG